MVEVAVLELTARTEGLLKAEAALGRVTAAAGKTEAAANVVASATDKASGKMSAGAYQARLMAQQLSQVAQQSMAGGGFIRALAIQLPDMAAGFGAVGIAVGVAAGIILPMLASAFGEVKDLDTALSDVNETLSDTKAIADLVRGGVTAMTAEFGRFGDDISALVDAQRQLSLRNLASDADALALSMANLYNGNAWLNISRAEELGRSLNLTTEATNLLDRGLTALSEADTLDRQLKVATALRESFVMMVGPVVQMTSAQKDFYFGLVDTEAALNKVDDRVRDLTPAFGLVKGAVHGVNDAMLALLANVPSEGWLSGAISDAATLAKVLWDAAHAAAVTDSGISVKATATTKGQGVIQDPNLIDTGQDSGGYGSFSLGMGRGGGGGATDPFAADLEALQTSLQTQAEAEALNYEERHNLLLEARERDAITQAEYNAMYEAEENRHAMEMYNIKQAEADMVRSASDGMYGALGDLLGQFAGKSKAAAIAQILLNKGLAITTIIQNTAAASMRALAELGPVAGTAAAAKIALFGKLQAGIVAATGFGQIASASAGSPSIGGGSSYGSNVGQASSATVSTPQKVLRIEVKGDGAYAQMLRDHIGVIGEALQEQMGIGGFVVT